MTPPRKGEHGRESRSAVAASIEKAVDALRKYRFSMPRTARDARAQRAIQGVTREVNSGRWAPPAQEFK